MSMTKDEIFSNVQEVLVEALGADEEEITENASLTGDLGAESIDFLDIVFRLEKAFSTDDAFKISRGTLPENLMDNDDWISDGKFTDSGLAMLRERMPHIDFTSFARSTGLEGRRPDHRGFALHVRPNKRTLQRTA